MADKKNLRRVTITVTAQTLHHLTTQAGADGRRALGQEVDRLVREDRLAAKSKTKPARRANITNGEKEKYHGIF